jgi:glycosyltransferase involved in cell wall biosynthesis
MASSIPRESRCAASEQVYRFVGCRFYPRKRLDVLLQAAALLRTTIPKLEIRIVGNGPEYKRLQRICLELDLSPVVQWLGDMPFATLAEEYNRAHVFCLPSVQEGFGIVFLEAMAAGKPIVAARAAAVAEVVRGERSPMRSFVFIAIRTFVIR